MKEKHFQIQKTHSFENFNGVIPSELKRGTVFVSPAILEILTPVEMFLTVLSIFVFFLSVFFFRVDARVKKTSTVFSN